MQAPAGLDNYDLKYKLRPATENCQTKGFELVEPETLTIANSVYDGFGSVLLGVSGIMKMKWSEGYVGKTERISEVRMLGVHATKCW